MNDRRASESGTGRRRVDGRPLGKEGHDDELQTDQGAGRRADDDVEVAPFSELRHGEPHSP